jgi:hypothetical protein
LTAMTSIWLDGVSSPERLCLRATREVRGECLLPVLVRAAEAVLVGPCHVRMYSSMCSGE